MRFEENETNGLLYEKHGHRFIYIYQDGDKAEVLRAIGRQAADPELSFSWYDAAVLSQKIRKTETT